MKCPMTITLYHPERTDVFYPDVAQSWSFAREASCEGYPIYSGVMFCPVCCQIWAKLTMETGEFSLFHEARTIPCSKHPQACHEDLRPVAGSLLDNPTANGYDIPLLEALPPDLLEREFRLTMSSLLTKEIS